MDGEVYSLTRGLLMGDPLDDPLVLLAVQIEGTKLLHFTGSLPIIIIFSSNELAMRHLKSHFYAGDY